MKVEVTDIEATGTPGATTFLRGDKSWAVPAGGGSSPWALSGSTTIAAPTASVNLAGLAGVTEIMIVCDGVTMSASDVPVVRVSTNNGSSYFSASGDYRRIGQNGTTVAATNGASFWNANATAARYGTVRIIAANVTGAPRVFIASPNDSSPMGMFIADNSNDIDAVRVISNGGATMNAGTIYFFTR